MTSGSEKEKCISCAEQCEASSSIKAPSFGPAMATLAILAPQAGQQCARTSQRPIVWSRTRLRDESLRSCPLPSRHLPGRYRPCRGNPLLLPNLLAVDRDRNAVQPSRANCCSAEWVFSWPHNSSGDGAVVMKLCVLVSRVADAMSSSCARVRNVAVVSP